MPRLLAGCRLQALGRELQGCVNTLAGATRCAAKPVAPVAGVSDETPATGSTGCRLGEQHAGSHQMWLPARPQPGHEGAAWGRA